MRKGVSNSTRTEARGAWFASGWRAVGAGFLLALGMSAWGADPQVNLSQSQLTFQPQAEGTASAPLLVVLTNSGQADLSITGIAITGQNNADFSHTSNCPIEPAKLVPQAHCEIHVTFRPAVTGNTGSVTAVLSVADNGSGSPQMVNLTGTSMLPVPMLSVSPPSLDFGSQAEGTTSAVRVVVLTNSGSAPLHVNSEIIINGPAASEFHIRTVKNSCPTGTWVLPPNSGCELGVVFLPATIGAKSAQIVIVDDAAGTPQSIEISATAN